MVGRRKIVLDQSVFRDLDLFLLSKVCRYFGDKDLPSIFLAKCCFNNPNDSQFFSIYKVLYSLVI